MALARKGAVRRKGEDDVFFLKSDDKVCVPGLPLELERVRGDVTEANEAEEDDEEETATPVEPSEPTLLASFAVFVEISIIING